MNRKSSPLRRGLMVLLDEGLTDRQVDRLFHSIGVFGEIVGIKVVDIPPEELGNWFQRPLLTPEEMKGSGEGDEYIVDRT
jgi:hypothetical protein